MNTTNELEKLLWAFQDDYGNSFSEWKNKDYDFAQTLPENEQEQIRPELIQALTAYITKARIDELKFIYSNSSGGGDWRRVINNRIKELEGGKG